VSRAQAATVTAADSSGYMLWRAGLAWQRSIRGALEPYDMTHVQFAVLASAWRLAEVGEEPTQRQVAAHAGIDEMMTSQVLPRLEAAGLVIRSASVRDRRVRNVELTPVGRDVLRDALRDVGESDARFFASLGGGEAAFRRSLHTLVASNDRPVTT
jgi:DNA-binding MarR family transcriptional regulator